MPGAASEFDGKRILLVGTGEGLTDELRGQLTRQGADVLGPMPSTGADLALMEIGSLDAAILDANLDPATAFFLAEALEQNGVPYLFVVPPRPDKEQGRYSCYELGTPSTLEIIGRALFGQASH